MCLSIYLLIYNRDVEMGLTAVQCLNFDLPSVAWKIIILQHQLLGAPF